MNRPLLPFVIACFLFAGATLCPLLAQRPKSSQETTAAEAAKRLELSKLPLPKGSTGIGRRNLAGLTYEAKGTVAAFDEAAGAASLSKEKGSLAIRYTDTGLLPAEVEIDAAGVELGRAE